MAGGRLPWGWRAVALAAALLVAFGPAFVRHGLSALLIVSRGVEAANPYRIHVQPGNVTIPRGADLTVTASLDGFSATDATLIALVALGILVSIARSAPPPVTRLRPGRQPRLVHRAGEPS